MLVLKPFTFGRYFGKDFVILQKITDLVDYLAVALQVKSSPFPLKMGSALFPNGFVRQRLTGAKRKFCQYIYENISVNIGYIKKFSPLAL